MQPISQILSNRAVSTNDRSTKRDIYPSTNSSTRLVDNPTNRGINIPTNRTPIRENLNISSTEVENLLNNSADVVDKLWIKRHAKCIYKIGIPAYKELAEVARSNGKNSIAYMAKLVNKELKR